MDHSSIEIAASIAHIVLTIGAIAISYSRLLGKLENRLDVQDVKIRHIEDNVNATKTLLVTSAVDASRLSRAEQDIHDMRRGVGFIRDSGETSVNREY